MDSHAMPGETVYKTLLSHLDEQDAAIAQAIWNTNYAGSRAHSLVTFVKELSNRITLSNDSKQKLLIALYKCLQTNPAQTAVVPAAPAQTATQARKNSSFIHPEPALLAPDLLIFSKLVEQIITDIRQQGAAVFINFTQLLQEKMYMAKLPAQTCEGILLGCIEKEKPDCRAIARRHLHLLVNIFYIALCEAAGPTIADALLANAIHVVEQTPEARLYHPRQLL